MTILLVLGLGIMILPAASSNTNIPPEFQTLYENLDRWLQNYETLLQSQGFSGKHPVIFAAELLPANSNRGDSLLNPGTMQAVDLFLDRLQELGVQAVTFPIGFPMFTPDFPNNQAYVQFYRDVAAKIRERGLMFDVESSVLFANTAFSPLKIDYSRLTFEKFKADRKEMIQAIINELHPDYLNLGSEPDTQFQLLRFPELNDPREYANYVNYVLTGLDRGNTRIGAGIGTWGNTAYVKELLAKTTVDSIHIHVYPIVDGMLEKMLNIAQLAKESGKSVVLDEAWLYKIDDLSRGGVAAAPEAFKLDAFSFWAPLDQKFLELIAKTAAGTGIEYVSPFWATFFFGYIDYEQGMSAMSYEEIAGMVNRVAAQNILEDKFSSTGEFYRQLIKEFAATQQAQNVTSTTRGELTTSSTILSVQPPTPGTLTGFIVAAAVLIVLAAVLAVWVNKGKIRGGDHAPAKVTY